MAPKSMLHNIIRGGVFHYLHMLWMITWGWGLITIAPHADALEQRTWHCHDHDQGNIRSLRMLPSGNYSLHIAPRATIRTTINKTMINNKHYIAGHQSIAMWSYDTERIAWWRRSRASQESTKCRHWASILSDNIKRTHQSPTPIICGICHRQIVKKGLKVTGCPNKEQ